MAFVEDLLKGYRKFFTKYFLIRRSVYRELVKEGQSPKTLMIACSDSRVDPALITKASPGDIFVVRNVANIVPPYDMKVGINYATGAAIEFAVKMLKVEHIVVLGHTECAGVATMLQPKELRELPMVSDWVDIASKATEIAKTKTGVSEEERLITCGREALLVSIENLKTYDFVASRINDGSLSLHAWHFDLTSGRLYDYKFDEKSFEPLK